jgi:uncharacterized Fe-S cluster-containing MiaB family protein
LQWGKNPERLAELRHHNCKKSKEEIAKALHSNGRQDYIFALKQELEMYEMFQTKIAQCDIEIEKCSMIPLTMTIIRAALY